MRAKVDFYQYDHWYKYLGAPVATYYDGIKEFTVGFGDPYDLNGKLFKEFKKNNYELSILGRVGHVIKGVIHFIPIVGHLMDVSERVYDLAANRFFDVPLPGTEPETPKSPPKPSRGDSSFPRDFYSTTIKKSQPEKQSTYSPVSDDETTTGGGGTINFSFSPIPTGGGDDDLLKLSDYEHIPTNQGAGKGAGKGAKITGEDFSRGNELIFASADALAAHLGGRRFRGLSWKNNSIPEFYARDPKVVPIGDEEAIKIIHGLSELAENTKVHLEMIKKVGDVDFNQLIANRKLYNEFTDAHKEMLTDLKVGAFKNRLTRDQLEKFQNILIDIGTLRERVNLARGSKASSSPLESEETLVFARGVEKQLEDAIKKDPTPKFSKDNEDHIALVWEMKANKDPLMWNQSKNNCYFRTLFQVYSSTFFEQMMFEEKPEKNKYLSGVDEDKLKKFHGHMRWMLYQMHRPDAKLSRGELTSYLQVLRKEAVDLGIVETTTGMEDPSNALVKMIHLMRPNQESASWDGENITYTSKRVKYVNINNENERHYSNSEEYPVAYDYENGTKFVFLNKEKKGLSFEIYNQQSEVDLKKKGCKTLRDYICANYLEKEQCKYTFTSLHREEGKFSTQGTAPQYLRVQLTDKSYYDGSWNKFSITEGLTKPFEIPGIGTYRVHAAMVHRSAHWYCRIRSQDGSWEEVDTTRKKLRATATESLDKKIGQNARGFILERVDPS